MMRRRQTPRVQYVFCCLVALLLASLVPTVMRAETREAQGGTGAAGSVTDDQSSSGGGTEGPSDDELPSGSENPDNSDNPNDPDDPENPEEPEAPAYDEPPTVEVERMSQTEGRCVDTRWFVCEHQRLHVTMTGAEVDMQQSTVLGVPLSQMLENEKVRFEVTDGIIVCEGWSSVQAESGCMTCSGDVTLLDGAYGLEALAEVYDAQGRHEAATLAAGSEGVTSLVVDTVAPAVSMDGTPDGAHVRERSQVFVKVEERHLGLLAATDATQQIVTITRDGEPHRTLTCAYSGAKEDDDAHTYAVSFDIEDEHRTDGVYEVVACVRDMAGNASAIVRRTVVVDTTAPTLDVSVTRRSDGRAVAHNEVVGEPVVAHLCVHEQHFSTDELNGGQPPVTVRVFAASGGSVQTVQTGMWHEATEAHSFVRDITFPDDGTYWFEVQGVDHAGNALVGTMDVSTDAAGTYRSPAFVIDQTDPVVTIELTPSPDTVTRFEDLSYYAKPVTATITVVDRTFDPNSSTITNSLGKEVVPTWVAKEGDADGQVTHVASCTFIEEHTGMGAGMKHLIACARDQAGNSCQSDPCSFVVDQTAPTVRSASVNKRPSWLGTGAGGADPVLFYNEQDGAATTLTIAMEDEFGLRDVWFDDPDHVYDVRVSHVHGKKEATASVRLRDQATHGMDHDTAFGRDVRLFVLDMAGNARVWTLDRNGRVVADREQSNQNVPLAGVEAFPEALVNDVTAPRVWLSGIVPGTYYATDQVLHVGVEEAGFAYLWRFAPNRVVATVSRRSGDASDVRSSQDIVVNALSGSAPSYGYDHGFGTDGHYAVAAQLEDAAGNRSEVVTIAEFTIDKTVPVLEVTWDNEDARNGSFYRAPRTATVRVTEHNFDATLVDIRTTGTSGGWSSAGDIHTCEVVFASDAPPSAPHRLAVAAKDLAGNEALSYQSPEFVIDTNAPAVTIERVVSSDDFMVADSDRQPLSDGTAFAEACMPIVTCSDDANLDQARVEVSLVSARSGTQVEGLSTIDEQDKNQVVIDWGNLGLDQSGMVERYRPDADDIYTLRAKAFDLAGNESDDVSVTFSINRYGSNYLFEGIDGLDQQEDGTWQGDPLLDAPRIVVHEINVSGMDEADEDAHVVTKEHAHATRAIARTDTDERAGYTLSANLSADGEESWSEYVYTIQAGNFGKGSDSDVGDGGQGRYRVDVSSVDRAGNHNTTMAYWDDEALQDGMPIAKQSTVEFTLDEDGPVIEDVMLPGPLTLGGDYTASFHVTDEVTLGERIEVLVDGERVDVCPEGSKEAVASDGAHAGQGTYTFAIEPKPLWFGRSLQIHVADYTGLETRAQTVQVDGYRLTTGVVEGVVATSVCLIVALVARAMTNRRG